MFEKEDEAKLDAVKIWTSFDCRLDAPLNEAFSTAVNWIIDENFWKVDDSKEDD